jgi:membrane-bound lytic murein transglycosylase MltF
MHFFGRLKPSSIFSGKKTMKKLLIILLMLFSQVTFSQKYAGDSWAKVKAAGSGSLTVFYYEQPGLIYEEGGQMKGACAELLTEFTKFVEKKHGKKLTVKYAGKEPIFSDFLMQAQQCKDVMGITNVTITDERKKVMKFTPAFLSNPVVMITHKDAPALASLSEINDKFNGYSAEIISGSVHTKHMDRVKKDYMPKLKIGSGPSGGEILKKIETNPRLFTILDFTEYIDATRKNLPVKRQNVDFGAADELAFIMNKQTDWDGLWKEFMTPDYRKSVRYRKIIADNLGASFLSVLK